MTDVKLLKSWKITVTLLERARSALPVASEQHAQEQAALLAKYREFLEHNELGLALDTLEELGHLTPCRGRFWRDLERAAENMGLVDRLPAIRKSFELFSMQNDHDYHCRVCGLELDEQPWGADGSSPTFSICPCCGVEFGYGDCQPTAVVAWRDRWLAGGAKWSDPRQRPDDWSMQKQLQRIGVEP
jgi:hypothetical protein